MQPGQVCKRWTQIKIDADIFFSKIFYEILITLNVIIIISYGLIYLLLRLGIDISQSDNHWKTVI